MADRKTRRRNRLIILMVGMVGLAGAGVAGKLALEWRRKHNATQALARGMQAYEQGDYARALPDLGRAAGRIQDNPDLYYAVADSRRRIPEINGRHIASAIAFARMARDGRPDDLRPRLLLLELYRSAGFVSEMLDEADAVLARSPQDRDAHRARIGALLALGRRENALAAAQAAQAAHPSDIQFLQAHLDVLQEVGRPIADLQAEIQRHAQVFAADPRYVVLAGRIDLGAGDAAGAEEHARQALAMDLKDPIALQELLLLVDRLIAQDPTLFEQASGVVDAALRDPAQAPSLAAFVLARDWRLMQVGSARTRADALDPGQPDLPDEALGWGAVLASGPQAIRFEQALRARPASPARDAWLAALEASAALQARKLTEARAALDRAAAATPRGLPSLCPPVEMAEARLLLASGDTAAARSSLQRLGFENGWLIARAELLTVLLSQNKIADALAVLQADPLLSQVTALPRAFAVSAASLVVARQVGPGVSAEVLEFIERLAQDNPEDVDVRVCHAVTLMALDQAEEAQAILRTIDQEALGDDTRVLLAAAAGPEGVDLGAVDRFMAAPPQNPDDLLRAALVIAAATDVSTGAALFDRATEGATSDEQRLSIRVAEATYFDRVSDAGASEKLVALARDNPEAIEAQTALLDSASGWNAPDEIQAAIGRLRALTGEDKAAWKIYEARRLLTFEQSEASAAAAINLLNEARRTSWPNPTISDLLASAHLRNPTDPAARQRATRFLIEGVQASPEGATLYPRLIVLLRASGDAAEAARQLDALIARENIPTDLRLARADLALLAGRYPQARDDYRFLAARNSARARLGEANALVGLGEWRAAESIFARLIAEPSPAPAALIDYAEALAIYGHFDRGLGVLSALPEEIGDSRSPRELVIADYHLRHAPPEVAQAHLLALARGDDPQVAASAASLLARHHVQRGRAADAVLVADEFLARYPDNAGLREVRALARLTVGVEPDASSESLEELARLAAERDPDSTFALLTAAMVAHARQETTAAAYVARLEALIAREPTFLPTRAALVQTLLAQGRIADAAAAAGRASDTVPQSAEAAALAARTQAQAAQYPQAQVYIARWKALLRTPAVEPELLAAGIALAQGQPQAARVALTGWLDGLISQARETQANRPLIAAVLALDGQVPVAQSLFPSDTMSGGDLADYFIAAQYMIPSSVDAASAWLQAAGPRLTATTDRLALATALIDLGSSKEHAASLRASVQVLESIDPDDPDAADATSMLASARALLKDTAEAIAGYRRALARNPEDVLALNNLAMLLSRSPDTASEAVTHARTALTLAERGQAPPEVLATILDTCGVAMLAAGDAPAALASFRRGLELSPTSPGCQVGVVEALLAQSDLTAARAALGRVNAAAAEADSEASARLESVRRALR